MIKTLRGIKRKPCASKSDVIFQSSKKFETLDWEQNLESDKITLMPSSCKNKAYAYFCFPVNSQE